MSARRLIPVVRVHLTAAGLFEREFDRLPEPFEQADGRLAGVGEERVDQAGAE